ncbi:MAG: hypothetical protein QW815_00985 [Nitrososphaerota archaeon]
MLNCGGQASISISTGAVKKYLTLLDEAKRRSYLCRVHYREYKRLSRKDRDFERARYGP